MNIAAAAPPSEAKPNWTKKNQTRRSKTKSKQDHFFKCTIMISPTLPMCEATRLGFATENKTLNQSKQTLDHTKAFEIVSR